MLKLFLLNLWGNIKRSPIVSIILLIQMILFSYSIFDVIYTQQKSELNNSAFQKVYSNYSIYGIGVNSYNLTPEHHKAYRGKKFVSVDNTGFEQFEKLEEKIFEFENLKSAMLWQTKITLHEELEGIECNEETRSQYSFYYPQVSDPPSYALNAYTVDRDYIDIFDLSLDSGRLFTEEEFTVLDPTHVPVLLGYDYKDYFSIGETFEGFLFSSGHLTSINDEANKTVFEVIGFIAKGQLFIPFSSGSLNTYDNHVILPYVYNSVEEWLTIYEENPDYFDKSYLWTRYTAGLGTSGMMQSKTFLVEKGNEEAFVEHLQNAIDSVDDYDVLKIHESNKAATYKSDEVNEKFIILTVLAVVMLVFSLMNIIFSAVNNTSNNIKAYAVHRLIGATKAQILIFSAAETLLYSLIGFPIGFLFQYIPLSSSDYVFNPTVEPTIRLWFITAALFIITACVLSLIFVNNKLKTYSVAELIRGREVKKQGHFPVYKIVTFIMFLLSSVCITFMNSYNWQLEHIDRYQNNFLAEDTPMLYATVKPSENQSQLNIDPKLDEAENYTLDVFLNNVYDPKNEPKIRGWYYKGEVENPEITEGRFFTEEEISEECNYAVVGKNVLKDFVTEKDGKRFITIREREYEVIGTVGRKGHDTTVDDWVFLTFDTVMKRNSLKVAEIYIKGASEEETTAVTETIKTKYADKFNSEEYMVSPMIDLGLSKDILNIFIAMVFLTSVVFCIYYIDKLKDIINVKKFIGYSKITIFIDTVVEFVLISTASFISGNSVMLLLARTILKDIPIFAAFELNLTVISLSYSAILILSFICAGIAINKAFKASSRELKKG